jgi:hypothetical protein
VQFPGDPHDTELKLAYGLVFWTFVPNVAGTASPQVGPATASATAGTANTATADSPTAPTTRHARTMLITSHDPLKLHQQRAGGGRRLLNANSSRNHGRSPLEAPFPDLRATR